MIRNLFNEKWKKLQFDERISEDEDFLISNYGRVINNSKEKEEIRKKTFINGYETISLTQRVNRKSTSRYVHKLVAQHFLEKDSENQKYVLHLDYDKKNNEIDNLKWATKKEKEAHQFKNPIWKQALKNRNTDFRKLTEGKVKIIKRQLRNNRTRISMIAKRFGVSDTQIHRIKSGENWSHVN